MVWNEYTTKLRTSSRQSKPVKMQGFAQVGLSFSGPVDAKSRLHQHRPGLLVCSCLGLRAPQTYFPYSFFTTAPPFITNFTCCSVVTSFVGSPSTAMMSAHFPASSVPTLSDQPSKSASLMVAV